MIYAILGIVLVVSVASFTVIMINSNNVFNKQDTNMINGNTTSELVSDSQRQSVEKFVTQFCGSGSQANSNDYVIEYVLPERCEMPLGIAVNADEDNSNSGKVWYISTKNGTLGRLDIDAGKFSNELPIPSWPSKENPVSSSQVWDVEIETTNDNNNINASVGDVYNFKDLQYSGETFNSTLISYYDEIQDFIFDLETGSFSWPMPFYYNLTRLRDNPIFVHEEIKLPKALFGNGMFNATVNGDPVSGRTLAVDPFTDPDAVILHYLINKNAILELAEEWQQQRQIIPNNEDFSGDSSDNTSDNNQTGFMTFVLDTSGAQGEAQTSQQQTSSSDLISDTGGIHAFVSAVYTYKQVDELPALCKSSTAFDLLLGYTTPFFNDFSVIIYICS